MKINNNILLVDDDEENAVLKRYPLEYLKFVETMRYWTGSGVPEWTQ